MDTTTVLAIFKKAIVSFLDELIDQFPQESNLILCRLFVKDQVPIGKTMENFIYRLDDNNGRLKLMAKERDDTFFLKGNIFYIGNNPACEKNSLGGGAVNYLRQIWQSNLDEDDRQTIWKWFDSFIILAEKYKESLK